MARIYKVLLVDDEDQVRGRIKSMLKDIEGFTVVSSASNGVDALEVLEHTAVDLVITDIKMPFIDGIELTREIKREYPKIKVAYLSGYDDFQFAKEAIDLEVVSYLMKPIIKEDLNQVLMQIKKRLDEEFETLYNEQRLRVRYEESLPLLVDHKFNRLLHLERVTQETLEEFKVYNIDLSRDEFVIALIDFSSENFKENEELRVFLVNLIGVLFKHYKAYYAINTASGLALIINHAKLFNRNLTLEFRELVERALDYSSLSLTIGLSNAFLDFTRFNTFYEQASKALSYSQYLNVDSILLYSDIQGKREVRMSLTDEERLDIERLFKFGTSKELNDWVDKFKERLNQQETLIDQEILVVNLASLIIHFSQDIDVNVQALFEGSLLEHLLSAKDAEKLLTSVKDIVLKIRKEKASLTKKESNQLTTQIKNYVDTHFIDPDLNMDKVCDVFAISVSYLSVLFKKETQMTFNKYIIAKRMEKAKEYLRYSTKKILEIAQAVGYREVYHFSHSFKKVVGQSPKEYREVHRV